MASGVGPGEHGEKSGIWIINLLTATPRQILGNAEGAVPSPDGTLVAFRSSNSPALNVVDVNGENLRTIATATLNETFGQLEWSPDGKRVGVIVRRVGDPQGSIDGVEVSNGRRSEIARVPRPRSFVWLADGRMLVSSTDGSDAGTSVLWEVDKRGNPTQVPIGAGNTVAQMSATADGKRLVLIRENRQSDAYVATITGNDHLADARRVTLDDRDDFPSGWLSDGRAILFASTRNGTLDVFRQAIDSSTAEQMASGPEQQFGAEAVFGGKTILYWSSAEGAAKMRLMKTPAGCGPADVLFEAPQGSSFHCAAAVPTCYLATIRDGKVDLSRFTVDHPERTPAKTLPVQAASGDVVWGVAADGSRAAYADAAGLNVIGLGGGESWNVPAAELPGKLSGVAAGPNPSAWIVTTTSARENDVLLASRARVVKLWTSPRPLASPALSPDGKRLVFGLTSTSSNAWLIENF